MFTKLHQLLVFRLGLIFTLIAWVPAYFYPGALADMGVSTQVISPVSLPVLPALEDWQSGAVASRGALGEWDHYLWGGFANSLIKKGDTFYLYYQGSPTYDNQCDSVAYRAIGLATSTDGIHWVKSNKNPIISWASQGSLEEGAVSSAAWLGVDGKIYIYYGANTGTACNVHANARLAVSEDGENFQDVGQVLSGIDANVWGSGDEIFPVGAYSYENKWYLYYVPNGVALSRKLGIGMGTTPTQFSQTMGLNNATVPAWGPVSIIPGGSYSVLVTNPGTLNGLMNMYSFSSANPSSVSLLASYALPDCTQASVLYEVSENHWMMACRGASAENYLIKHAYPVHTFSDVPPSYWAESYIERLYDASVASGCSIIPLLLFCPSSTVARDQMAIFLLRGKHGSDYMPPSATGVFHDVPPDRWAAAWIEQLAVEGITSGCGSDNYCPGMAVTRDQMAVFLLRAKHGASYNPPAVGDTTGFVDVPTNYWAAPWIKQLVNEGITVGCGNGNYCPGTSVSRAEMAVFLVRTFNLP
jgi:hypothetical protein